MAPDRVFSLSKAGESHSASMKHPELNEQSHHETGYHVSKSGFTCMEKGNAGNASNAPVLQPVGSGGVSVGLSEQRSF